MSSLLKAINVTANRVQNPSFATARVEHCVSCQVLNLLLCPSVMKMGAFQPSFSCSIPPSLLPSTAHFCDGNLSLDTQKVTQRPAGRHRRTDGQPSVHPTHAWQAVGSHFCNANAAHRRVARKANLHIPMSRENPCLASSNCLTPLGERATLFRGRERERLAAPVIRGCHSSKVAASLLYPNEHEIAPQRARAASASPFLPSFLPFEFPQFAVDTR